MRYSRSLIVTLMLIITFLTACQAEGGNDSEGPLPTLMELPTLPPDELATAQAQDAQPTQDPTPTQEDLSQQPNNPNDQTNNQQAEQEQPVETAEPEEEPNAEQGASVGEEEGSNNNTPGNQNNNTQNNRNNNQNTPRAIVIEGEFNGTYNVVLPPGWQRDPEIDFNVVNGEATVSITQVRNQISQLPLEEALVTLYAYDEANENQSVEYVEVGGRQVAVFTEAQPNGTQTVIYHFNLRPNRAVVMTIQPGTPNPNAIRDDILFMVENIDLQ